VSLGLIHKIFFDTSTAKGLPPCRKHQLHAHSWCLSFQTAPTPLLPPVRSRKNASLISFQHGNLELFSDRSIEVVLWPAWTYSHPRYMLRLSGKVHSNRAFSVGYPPDASIWPGFHRRIRSGVSVTKSLIIFWHVDSTRFFECIDARNITFTPQIFWRMFGE
jgi:hypothetical protein